jgi:hypothetical protein
LRKYIFPFYDINYSKATEEEDVLEKEEDMDVEEARKWLSFTGLTVLAAKPTKRGRKPKRPKHLDHPSAMMYKIVEILDKLNCLVMRQKLPDSIILDITAISLPTFFVEDIHAMQLSALHVVRSVCCVENIYPKLTDIFALSKASPTYLR